MPFFKLLLSSVLLLTDLDFQHWDGKALTVYGAFVSVLLTIVSTYFWLFTVQLRKEQALSQFLRGELSKSQEAHLDDVKTLGRETQVGLQLVSNGLSNLSESVNALSKKVNNDHD